jgi:hypothetical protein
VVVTRDGIDDDDDNGGLLENGSIDFIVLLSVGATALLSVSATASALLLLLFSLNDASVADDELPSVRRLLLLQGADIAFQWK